MSGSKRVPHCVLQTSWTFSEADLKERVDKNENKAKPVQLLLHLTTQVILKLKIVFNLCLCSFFKRTRNRATKTSTATIPKMRILTTCVSVCFSSCTTNAHKPTDLWTGNLLWVFVQPEGWVYFCFPSFCPPRSLQELHGLQVQDVGMLVRLLPPGNTCGLAVTCVLVSCVSGAVNSHPPVCDISSVTSTPPFPSPGINLAMCVPISVTVSAEQRHSPAPNLHLNQTQAFSSSWGRCFWQISLVMLFDPGHDDPHHGMSKFILRAGVHLAPLCL